MRLTVWMLTAQSALVSLALFYSSAQRFPQTSPETLDMTSATGGRQVSIIAPAPTSQLQFGLGVLSLAATLTGAAALVGSVKEAREETDDVILSQPAVEISPPRPRPILELEPPAPTIPKVWTSPLLDSKKYPQLTTASHAGVLYLVGPQGSGKTTFLAALLAARFQKGHQIVVFSHHAAYGQYEPFRVYGGKGKDFDEKFIDIEAGIAALRDEVNRRYAIMSTTEPDEDGHWEFEKYPITALFDEFSSYGRYIKDKAMMADVMGMFTQEIRKACVFPIFAVHAMTKDQACGGTDGNINNIKATIPRVELGNMPDEQGGMRPSGYCNIYIPNREPAKNVRIPDRSEMLPNINRPLDFTSIAGRDRLSPIWEQPILPTLTDTEQQVINLAKEVITAKELVAREIARDEMQAKDIFASLGRKGLALTNSENTVCRLTTGS